MLVANGERKSNGFSCKHDSLLLGVDLRRIESRAAKKKDQYASDEVDSFHNLQPFLICKKSTDRYTKLIARA